MRIYLLAMFCVNAQVYSAQENVPISNDFGDFFENYLKPISKLSELFPDQKIEVQFEIDGSNHETSKRYLRQKIETSTIPSTTAPVTAVSLLASKGSEATDRPVYISDLRKMFDEFEKKHTTQFHDEAKQAPFVNIKQSVGNLNDLLDLLKKGVQVEKGIERPTEENMSWFQIKIPRN